MPSKRQQQPLWKTANPVHMDVRQVKPGTSAADLLSRRANEEFPPFILCMVVSKKRDNFSTIPAAAEWAKTFRTWQKGAQRPAVTVALVAALIPKFDHRLHLQQGTERLRQHWQDCRLLWDQGVTVFELKSVKAGGFPTFESFRDHFETVTGALLETGVQQPAPTKGHLELPWIKAGDDSRQARELRRWSQSVAPLFTWYREVEPGDLEY
jgi:hypothetical protein